MAKAQGRIGEQIGEYSLLRYLGHGSFGSVYLAEHTQKGSQVAIKLLHTPLTTSNDWQGFLNEARSIRLQHPHILPLLDFDISQQGMPFLVMEYAAGGTLRERFKRGERWSLATVCMYAMQLASALQYAHDRHLVHRDVKPENMLLRADGTVLLSDFGIARIVEQNSGFGDSTQGGTPAYMAPEQGKGHPCPASDQYALAVCVYEWIAGRRPFLGTPIEVAVQHQLQAPPPLRTLSPQVSIEVEQVLACALAKTPGERFPTVMDFAQELEKAIKGMGTATVDAFSAPTERAAWQVSPLVAGKIAEQPGFAEGEETVRKPAQTPVISQVNPLPLPPHRSIRQRTAGGKAALYWRLSAILLLLAVLVGSGVWYLALRPTQTGSPQSGSFSPLKGASTSGGLTATSTSAVNTPQPSPAFAPAVPKGWSEVLDDPMTASNHSSYWVNADGCTFLANNYQQTSIGSNYCSYGASAYPATVFHDVYYRMAVSIRQGNIAGIVFRNQKNNYYYLSITRTGDYSLILHSSADGGDDSSIAAGSSPAIRQGLRQWNTLAVLARGQTISLYINNTFITTVTNSARAQGVIGVAVNGPDLQGVSATAWFRNALVWTP